MKLEWQVFRVGNGDLPMGEGRPTYAEPAPFGLDVGLTHF